MKHSFGAWNAHVKKKGTIDTRVYNSLVAQFQDDIHNGKFIYHYELSRYHVLGMNLVAPVDHYYRIYKGSKKTVAPMGTFDHLIISMGVHLAHIHGKDNVVLLSTDDRLTNILKKCCMGLSHETKKKLKLDNAESVTGKRFEPATFPRGINLKNTTKNELEATFGVWPLPVGKIPPMYRWLKV